MKLIVVCIVVFFPGLSLLAQTIISGCVRDENGVAVRYATISYLNGVGVVCDSLGCFSIKNLDKDSYSSVVVSALGYMTDTLMLKKDSKYQVISLKKESIQLEGAAVISQQKIESKSTVSAFTTSKKEIARLNPNNITNLLQTKAGFTNSSGYQTPLILRGMSGKRILILRNGNRRFSSYPAGVMLHTINIYDLDRIEVEKGVASVEYGSGALAGVVNLIDKSPFKEKGFNAKVTAGYGSVNQEKNFIACGGWSSNKLAVKTVVRYRDANDYQYPDGTIAKNSFYSDKDAFITTGYKLSDQQILTFTADFHYGGPWGKAVGFNGSKYIRVYADEDNAHNYTFRYRNQQMGVFNNVELNAYYSNESRNLVKNYYTAAGYHLSYSETTYFSDYYYGVLAKGDIDITDNYKITTGVEAYHFNISFPMENVDYYYLNVNSFKNRVCEDANSSTVAVFAQNKYRLNSKLKVLFGFRYNYASLFEGEVYSDSLEEGRNETKYALNGNFGINYKFGKGSNLKVNIARTFRMPAVTELYADNSGSNGLLYGNPDLKPEYGNSLDLCFIHKSEIIDFELSPFYWFLEDMITKEEVMGSAGTNYMYTNVAKSRLWGGELSVLMHLKDLVQSKDNLSLSIGASYLNGTDISNEGTLFSGGTPLDFVPPFNMKTGIAYNCNVKELLKLNFGLNSIFYSEQNRLGESNWATPAYLIFSSNLGFSFLSLPARPVFNVVVKNLMNKEYYCYYQYLPAEGRDVRVFLTLNF